jgi:hydrogenase nickel incorporation protein HypA/HybF
MHEYGVCEGVLDAVRARAGGRKVAAIRVRFGVWHAVDATALADAFESVAAGTEAADAAIELVTVPAQIACRACGSSADSTDLLAVCPRCASTDVELAGGDEMTLESVTYVPEPAASDAT